MRSRFRGRRHPEFRAFIRAQSCLLAGRLTHRRLTPNDIARGNIWAHVCWGAIDPAHVNETVARGAYDLGEVVPLCRAAHRQLDQHLGPALFAQATELNLTWYAGGYAVKFVEQGGQTDAYTTVHRLG
jgi:hypothetical protein